MDEQIDLPALVDNMSAMIYSFYIDFFSHFAKIKVCQLIYEILILFFQNSRFNQSAKFLKSVNNALSWTINILP